MQKIENSIGVNDLKISHCFISLEKPCAPSVHLISMLTGSYPLATVVFPSPQKASWQGCPLLVNNDHFPTFLTWNVTPHLGWEEPCLPN